MSDERYVNKGFGLKKAIGGQLVRDYHSAVVDRMRSQGFRLEAGDLTFVLAQEFGFCYGVDRAVEYAYETREKFPDRRIFITGEIIHNPGVNQRLLDMGIRFLDGRDPEASFDRLDGRDVVILPAFGVPLEQMALLRAKSCILVDTTCGSVLNVWKNVEKYARDGFTALIHGKFDHEETRATASRALKHPDGRYLVVRDLAEARLVCDQIEVRGDRDRFLERFAPAISPGFDPDRDLERLGCANQTTMLSSESLAIADAVRIALERRHGVDETSSRFRAFDTICSATQERQDAVHALLRERTLDLMLVIGGYNSSNTTHLVEIAAASVPAYHIQNAASVRERRPPPPPASGPPVGERRARLVARRSRRHRRHGGRFDAEQRDRPGGGADRVPARCRVRVSLPDGPRANIEIKARVLDPEAAERIAESLGARSMGADRQEDTYFRVPRGRLKLRRSLFAGEQLVAYLRPDVPGPKRADYEVIPTPRDGRTREILEAMFGVEAVVRKVRRLWVVGDTRIHVDTVEGLGDFVEFEAVYPHGSADAEQAARLDVERLLAAFAIPPEDLVPHSYRELKRGQAPFRKRARFRNGA